jgi:hypothetical protein
MIFSLPETRTDQGRVAPGILESAGKSVASAVLIWQDCQDVVVIVSALGSPVPSTLGSSPACGAASTRPLDVPWVVDQRVLPSPTRPSYASIGATVAPRSFCAISRGHMMEEVCPCFETFRASQLVRASRSTTDNHGQELPVCEVGLQEEAWWVVLHSTAPHPRLFLDFFLPLVPGPPAAGFARQSRLLHSIGSRQMDQSPREITQLPLLRW